jgi:diguanylate cyclase (GGDEF)-like protein/PAS domain S-box-containing protein
VVWLGVLFAIAFWLVDSWIDASFFSYESIYKNLRPTGMELYMRTLVLFLIIAFVFLVSRIIAGKNRFILEIANSEERLRLALETANQGWFDVNLLTGKGTVSPEYAKMMGYDPADFQSTLQDWQNNIHSDDREAVLEAFQDCLNSGGPRSMEYRSRTLNDEWIWIHSIGKVTERDKNNQPLRMIGIHTNITERRNMEDALREQEEFFRLIAENGEDFIAVLDLEGKRRYNNPAYGKIFGNIEAMKGTDSFAEIHPEDRDRIKQMFLDTVHSGIGHRTEFRFVAPNGEIRYMESCGGLIKNSKGEATCVVVVSHDITERIRAEQEIRSLAFYDPLTNLPNRRLLEDRLNQAMDASKRSSSYGAVLFLDLDNFKPLNDVHGHDVGDLLLIEAGCRLSSCVRKVDTVARFGGDEFVVLLSGLDADRADSTLQANHIAEKIRTTLAEAYFLTAHQEGKEEITVEHHCTVTIGVVLFSNHDATKDDIFKCADSAMYQAKEGGRNCIRFYDHTT